ncbi:MAG: TerB family tellurite resistance protein [Rhodocyclaceae bacterium]|jgi:uncharacterized tellurite resistance protein B-like protein|nr:TerB family tellurite resistance protein [Rhodocyclaceae bacterium]MCO5096384.1 TerB family tellurite resistance protein [Rhodocyclaceae bacterium]
MPLKSLLQKLSAAPEAPPSPLPFPRVDLAVAALLLEAAQVDGKRHAEEHATVLRLIREHFRLPPTETAQLLQLAEGEFAASLDDWVFTQAVRDGFGAADRQKVLEMLWQVVYADGMLARFEEELLDRLAEALDIPPQAADAARERAFARITSTERGPETP